MLLSICIYFIIREGQIYFIISEEHIYFIISEGHIYYIIYTNFMKLPAIVLTIQNYFAVGLPELSQC